MSGHDGSTAKTSITPDHEHATGMAFMRAAGTRPKSGSEHADINRSRSGSLRACVFRPGTAVIKYNFARA
ncbi:MAG: hypothetical protein WD600_12295, partial [Pseudohongiella sp.]